MSRAPDTFPNTLRALESDRPARLGWMWLPAVALLGAWLAWALAAPVAVTVDSAGARFVGAAPPLALRAPAGARVALWRLAPGRHVTAGELVAVLEASGLLARRAALTARRESLAAEAAARRAEAAAARRGLAEQEQAHTAAAAERGQRALQEDTAARLSEQTAARQTRLAAAGVLAAADAARSRAEAEERRRAAGAAALAAAAGRRADGAALADRRAALARLAAEEARVQGEAAAAAAEAAALEREIARCTLLAPAAGLVMRALPVRPGADVAAGTVLALLIPDAPLRVTAWFAPALVGTLRARQRAWVHVASGPASPPVVLEARVSTVMPPLVPSAAAIAVPGQPGASGAASSGSTSGDATSVVDAPTISPPAAADPSTDTTEVELTVTAPPALLPAYLGQSCDVEVEVARTTPAALVLQALLGNTWPSRARAWRPS